ncbi:hypothetical protein MLD38_013104 [Melastoma candidum]|uniref:Uncharacterized protein n=1 Tax=Melastoma candidum TaxID=119954 RepID=A0ACB9R8G1_9MYRT|nr:hypothetical protein MLD38_013104 [Melastoma candidum]
MATPSHARAVKSLNTGPGRRRFVFKSFSQRLDDVEIDVYRSLDRVKPDPSDGSSFSRDCLLEWRELNTAEDFISYYEQTLPLVQNLPLILLHKDAIVSSLLDRLRLDARLSLEPLLRSLVALSRDLLEEFVPYLPRIVEALVRLLKAGGDREPEVLEQIFYAWSCILMHLQKYLIRRVASVFKVTMKLRYYPKGYVQEFMAKSMSFLLRNAPLTEMGKAGERSGNRTDVDEEGRTILGLQNLLLPRGLRKIMVEVAKKPSDNRKFAAAALLYHTLIGTSSKFHSKAGMVLSVLLDKSICGIGDEVSEEPDCVVGVMIATFQRLCEELDREDLHLLWDCLLREVIVSVNDRSMLHLRRLLTILASIVQIDDGHKVSDYELLIKQVTMVVRTFFCHDSSTVSADGLNELLEVVIRFIIGVVAGLSHVDGHTSILASCSEEWGPIFNFQTVSLLAFIRELLLMKSSVFLPFKNDALKVLDNLVEASPEQVLHLFFQLSEKSGSPNAFERIPGETTSRIRQFLEQSVTYWKTCFHNFKPGDGASISVDDSKFSSLWGVIRCYPLIFTCQEDAQALIDFVDDVDRIISFQNENILSHKHFWLNLIGASLTSYKKLKCGAGVGFEDVSKFMQFARKYPFSRLVLTAVADYLDDLFGSSVLTRRRVEYHPEFEKTKFADAVDIFNKSLSHPDKAIRVSTLRLLCHYEPMREIDVLQILLSIETTPLSVEDSRKVVLSISKLQMEVSAGEVSESYVLTLLYGVIGMFNNRFSYLWEEASECLALLVRKHVGTVWEKFMYFLEELQSKFLALDDHVKENEASLSDQSDFMRDFHDFLSSSYDSTPPESVLSLLIQSLQKIPAIIEARSRHVVPLFLRFLGYGVADMSSVGSYDIRFCKGKGWKSVLKEWLNLFKLMRDPKSLYQGQFLKEVFQIRLLEENDPEVQLKVLDCLLNWKDDFLLPYAQNLRNLINSKTLRNELTTWSLSEETGLIDASHRAYVVPLVIRILALKVRNSKRNLRRAVLSFIAQLAVKELPLFFLLLIKPLHDNFAGSDRANHFCWFPGTHSLNEFPLSDFLVQFTVDDMSQIYWKKREGFLNVIKDVLGTFDQIRLEPFIDLLMGFVVRMLGFCSRSVDLAKRNNSSAISEDTGSDKCNIDFSSVNQIVSGGVVKHLKKLRSLCLEIIASVSNRYEDHDFGSEFWDLFFDSVKPLTDNFKEEGSSSEKPSSLFLCFIAMSRCHRLASRLLREKQLVADIFSMLTITTITEAIGNAVFEFTENLLSHYEIREEHAESNLFPTTGEVIHSLYALFLSNSPIKRKLVKFPEESLLRIFKLLSPHVLDELLGKKFMEVLLQFLTKCAHKQDVCADILGVVKEMVRIVSPECNKDIIKAFSPLLTWVELELRSSICDILLSLSPSEYYVPHVGMLLCEMNKTSIEGLDFDAVIGAYGRINVKLFHSVGFEHALLILSQCVYHMSSDDLILRESAYQSLSTFVEFSCEVVGRQGNDGQELQGLPTVELDHCWTLSSIRHIVGKFLIDHMGNAMKRQAPIRKEWFELLRKMVEKLPDVAQLGTFQLLCSEDAEVDFFKNIVHIQKHRRARALTRFKNIMSKSNMSKDIIDKVFLPLFFNMLFDAQALEAEQIKNACVEALASVAGFVDWKAYYALLMRCFHEIAIDPKKQKLLLRLICSILDQFHFFEVSPDNQSQETLNTPDGNIQSGLVSAESRTCHDFVVPVEIQEFLLKTLLPKIQKLLDSDTDKLNATINLVALKLFKLLPRGVLDSQLPGVIHRISNFLKSRMESVRDEARLALAACLKELGFEYLQFIVKVLRSILKRGFELHVLGYTVNFILSKFLTSPSVGKLDYCLEDLLLVVRNDILGGVSEEKEVEKIAAKMKETRKKLSFETLKMIAQNITFRSNVFRLLSLITSHQQNNLTPKMKSNLEEMLRHIAIGIESNPSVDQNNLFIFIHGIVKDGINGELVRDTSITVPFSKERVDMGKKTSTQGSLKGSPASYLLVGFALSLLNAHLKKLKGAKNDAMLLNMLDPFVALLCHCLGSKYETIIASSISCLTRLVRLPLPSLGAESDKIKDTLLDVAHGSTSSGSNLMESSLKMLTVLLSSENMTLSSGNLLTLIKFPVFVDLDRNPSPVALSLLKAIVGCKAVVPEIYDMMNRVGELMVRSQSEAIRRKCSEILLQFLLDYPLSEKRLGQHLDFLLSNLSYEHSTGREAALEMIHAIIMKFPSRVLEKQAQTLFLHMVVGLANDPDNKVRSMTGAAIKRLVGRMGPHSLQSVVTFSLSWYFGEKCQLRSAAAQVMGLLVEVMKGGFQEHIPSILPVVTATSKAAVKAISVSQEDSSDEAIPFWKEAYYSLIMLEKILAHFPYLFFEADSGELWKAVFELLLHPHLWLRNVTARLVASFFATVYEAVGKKMERVLDNNFLTCSRLFITVVSFCDQMKTQIPDDAAETVISENLTFVLCCLNSLMGRMEPAQRSEFWLTVGREEQLLFLEAFQLLGSKDGEVMFLSLTSGAQEKSDGGLSNGGRYFLVSCVLRRMGEIALRMDLTQMKIAFRCFQRFVSQIIQGDSIQYAYELLLPLYKVSEGFAGKFITDDMKELAQEVSESLKKSLGADEFMRVYSLIRKDLKSRRDKRKREENVMAVVNPMRNAKRKLRISAKHRANKKRKMASMKMARWMH